MAPHQNMLETGTDISFEVQLNWLCKHKGILWADDVEGTINVATPEVFGGEGNEWSPEHLFLGSLSSCFMSTYLNYAKKIGCDINRLTCSTQGTVELINGKYEFIKLDVFPMVYVSNEEHLESARLALEKAEKYCLTCNSVKGEVVFHGNVFQEPQALYWIQ